MQIKRSGGGGWGGRHYGLISLLLCPFFQNRYHILKLLSFFHDVVDGAMCATS